MAPARPRVAIIGTGGTISTVSRHPLDLFDYGSKARILEIDDLIDRIPQIADFVEAIPVRSAPSTASTLPSVTGWSSSRSSTTRRNAMRRWTGSS